MTCCNHSLVDADAARAEITEAPPVAYGFVVVNTDTRTVHDRHIFDDRAECEAHAAPDGLRSAAIAWRP